MYKSFIALVTFICKYLVLSDAIDNGTGFYTFRHGFSLLWYRNSTDFCMFILSPANLLSVFVVTTSRFMMDSLLIYTVMLSVIQFYFLLSHLDAFIYHFFCLLALARRLNSSGENGHVEQNGFCS